MNGLIARMKGAWAFLLAASTAPLSYILTGPCTSVGCAACPLGGACLFSLPVLFVGIVLAKGYRRIREWVIGPRDKDNGGRNIITVEGGDN